MATPNEDFLQAAIKSFSARRWETLAAQITDRITVLVRVPSATLTRTISPAEQAIQLVRQVASDGWRLTGFNFDGQHLLIDMARDLLK